jgi:acetyl-CoA acetyltransferase
VRSSEPTHDLLANRAAVVGIGATEFSRSSGRSESRLAIEATRGALDDCGLLPSDVDGIVTFSVEDTLDFQVANNIGTGPIRFHAKLPYGGSAGAACLHLAAMAVVTGAAEVVLIYRAMNGRSGHRYSRSLPLSGAEAAAAVGLYAPFGLTMPAQFMALLATRYMHETGASTEDFGRVAVVHRRNAATNPAALWYGRPISPEDHANSRWISEPLRLLDCCQESDGAQAIVVTSIERARDLRARPVLIRAAAQGMAPPQELGSSFYRESITALPEIETVASDLFRISGLERSDIRVAMLYDHFTPLVLMQLERLGFCAPGEARHMVADGAIDLEGSLPVNPHGGLLGEAYVHGLNSIAEAVRQVRGTAANQVAGVEHVLVTSGAGGPASGAILGG